MPNLLRKARKNEAMHLVLRYSFDVGELSISKPTVWRSDCSRGPGGATATTRRTFTALP